VASFTPSCTTSWSGPSPDGPLLFFGGPTRSFSRFNDHDHDAEAFERCRDDVENLDGVSA
jgi:hypothetical protein